MKYFVLAGEISGDMHLANLIKVIKQENKNAEFFGMCGKYSAELGVNVIQDISDLAIMGFVEAIKKYSFMKKLRDKFINYIIEERIKNVILVDYGGFNLMVLDELKKRAQEVKVFYYIPPKIWIWGKKRIHKIKKADYILVIFPWEVDFYKSQGVNAIYFGNPLVDKCKPVSKGEHILLLPGSRKQEIKSLLSDMNEVADKLKEEKFLLKLADKSQEGWIEDVKLNSNILITYDSLESAVSMSKLAIAASGTVTLELALMELPTIVGYKTSLINEIIVRLFVNLTFVSLPNLTLKKEIFKELLQRDFNKVNILEEISNIENNYKILNKKLSEVRTILGGENITAKFAKFVITNSQPDN